MGMDERKLRILQQILRMIRLILLTEQHSVIPEMIRSRLLYISILLKKSHRSMNCRKEET